VHWLMTVLALTLAPAPPGSEVTVESFPPAVDQKGRLRPLEEVVEPERDLADYAGIGARIALVPVVGAWLWITVSARRQRRRLVQRFNRQQALRALERSRQRGPDGVDAFYSDVSDTLRRFVQARSGIPAPVLSSTEIVAAVKRTGTRRVPLQPLAEVLAAVDAVRFGGRIPTGAERREVLELTKVVLGQRVAGAGSNSSRSC
jgi:hypothetical protein